MSRRGEKALAGLAAWGFLIYLAIAVYEFVEPWVSSIFAIATIWLAVKGFGPPLGRYRAHRRSLREGYRPGFSGVEYEEYCAALLRQHGWTVTTTPATGDHGADLIIRKGGADAAIQCKHYSRPVGVKAVQEALSARTYYGTDAAFVVTNTGFTPNAVALARRAQVELLHHSALGTIDGRMPTKTRWWALRRARSE